MEKYEYKVDEKSLLQDTLISFIWAPIVQFLPSKLKPNTITIIGFFCMLLSGLSIWLTFSGHHWAFLTAAIFLFLYTACDNIDGMHARKTGQSSKLGEFLDHWLDSFSCIVVNMAMAIVLGLNGWLLIFYCVSIGIAFFGTIWEHHYTGIFRSGRLGTNEGLFMIMVVYLILFILQRPTWLIYQNSWDNPVAIGAIFTIIVSIYTALRCIFRVKKHLIEFLLLFTAMVIMAAWNYLGYMSDILTAILILTCNTIFCGKLIVAHLIEKTSPYRYPLTLLFVIIGCGLLFIDIDKTYYTYTIFTAYTLVIASLLTDGLRGLYFLRKT